MQRTFLIFLIAFQTVTAGAQKKLPVIIKASSMSVDIRDGDEFNKNAWTISPQLKPDVYTTSSRGRKVTFYTDKDSITVKITPTTKFDFVILVNDSIWALTEIKYVPAYLDVLKGAGKYNPDDLREIPPFTYQEQNHPQLAALRKGFNLDSVAGTGNDASQIINLMHWIHNLVPHDGEHNNPEVMNALSMIEVCRKEKRGLNCRGLATVLNECYLSMGIPSRFVTCLPKDSTDQECHVINMVYANNLQKWLWIDPTNDAYVMDEKGTLLGIEEVRERLITDKPLIVNPDANWNHKSSVVKENYLYKYMAKNLYRFECPVRSEYDTETRVMGKEIAYVQLLPLDYFEQKPDKTAHTNKNNGTTFINYKTNNPKLFWQAPPDRQKLK
jgi:hypothetical protein